MAGPKPLLEKEVAVARLQPALGLPRKAPLRARDLRVGSVLPLAHEQDGRRIVQIRDGVGPTEELRERRRANALARAKLDADGTPHGLALQLGEGRVEEQGIFHHARVRLPRDGGHRVAAPEQESVAGRERILHRIPARTVECGDGERPAAIRHVEQQPAVSACWIPRYDQNDVALEADPPGWISRGELEVHDPRTRRVERIDGVARARVDALVGAHVPELAALCVGLASLDLEFDDAHG